MTRLIFNIVAVLSVRPSRSPFLCNSALSWRVYSSPLFISLVSVVLGGSFFRVYCIITSEVVYNVITKHSVFFIIVDVTTGSCIVVLKGSC